MNYLGKFSSATTEVFELLRKPMSLKIEGTWNSTYQHIKDRAKAVIKKDTTLTFCNEKEEIYLETDAVGVGLGASLLQVRDGMWFPTKHWKIQHYSQQYLQKKSLTKTETQYSNIEREALGILLSCPDITMQQIEVKNASSKHNNKCHRVMH